MTEEQKRENTETKYFYIEKENVYKALCGIGTSFIGASLALLLFAAVHKPPIQPCPDRGMPPIQHVGRPCPCPCHMKHHRGMHSENPQFRNKNVNYEHKKIKTERNDFPKKHMKQVRTENKDLKTPPAQPQDKTTKN